MEILSPAGNFTKLKFALNYGADAVYAAGKSFGLRAKADNFSEDELKKATEYCHNLGKKIYITVNIYAKNVQIEKIEKYMAFLNSIQVDALIISDVGLFLVAKEFAPDVDVHVSTQANVTSYKSAEFWYKAGAKRVILARELSIKEISEIKEKIPDLELEMFVHGAMCIAYSGRCLLSAFFNNRSANQGLCTQPCRWKYALTEETRPGQYFPIEEDENGTFILNSKDLCLYDYLQQIKDAGLDSIKIEGRMKSPYYVANVTRIYKKGLELLEENKSLNPYYKEELSKVSHRVYTSGFADGFDSNDTQHYETSAYERNYQYLGEVINIDNEFIEVDIKAKFSIGDDVDFIFPDIEDDFTVTISQIYDREGNLIEFTKPNTIIRLRLENPVKEHCLLRKKI